MQVKGTIVRINDTQVVSDKFSKRMVFVQTDDQYPQTIGVQFENSKCDMLDKYSAGDVVSVSVNVRGRDWQSNDGVKNITYLQVWKIDNEDIF